MRKFLSRDHLARARFSLRGNDTGVWNTSGILRHIDSKVRAAFAFALENHKIQSEDALDETIDALSAVSATSERETQS